MPFIYDASAVTEGLVLCVCSMRVCMPACSFVYGTSRSISRSQSPPLYSEAKPLDESGACTSSQSPPEIPCL